MEKSANGKTIFTAAPLGQSLSLGKDVQLLRLGEKGRLTYAASGRAVSKKLSDRLGISKFNFL